MMLKEKEKKYNYKNPNKQKLFQWGVLITPMSCFLAALCVTENQKVNLPITKWEADQTRFIRLQQK